MLKHRNWLDKFEAFVDSLKKIFFIGKCRCELQTKECSCGSIPVHLKAFILDQYNDRKLTIPEYTPSISEQVPSEIPTIPLSNDPLFEPYESEMHQSAVVEQPLKRGRYTPRYDALDFAMMCDRFGVSDRVASGLATALFKDLNIRDDLGELVVMDKSKVARERQKCRDMVLRKRNTGSCLSAFSFDGRKNESLRQEKIHEKFHQNMVKEHHLVVTKEPNAILLGYVNLDAENAETQHRNLNEFFTRKGISLDALIGICCDGEVTNTGVDNGILRRFELQLERPLHWFVCLLHFNELPFRHLYDTLEKSATTGPRSSTGGLAQKIEECHKLPVCNHLFIFRIPLKKEVFLL